ncbi:glycosyltransferase family A protein [Paraglaciecola sp. 25GB23A]|uniref:glycosyltransferase family A protein n=1 Tax=Paraglaciecola sp. 25GB23A TaxID=3156068 RepID=UPI0032AEC941
MFIFLLALKHPDTANDYQNVERLLSNTLHSVVGQTVEDFRVVVVCNRLPQVSIQDDRIHFHVVHFPAVAKENGKLNVEQKFTDKGSKYLSGLLYAKQFNPIYVYILDSDDWVNTNFIAFLNSAPAHPIWYVDKGYFVNLDKKEYKKRSGLVRYCGSTFVYDYQFLMSEANIHQNISSESTQKELIDATSHFFVVNLLSNHLINFNYFKNKGFIPKALPFYSACWIQGTGENVSNTAGGDAGLPMDNQFIKTFHLPDELENENRASLKLYIRDFLSGLKSMYSWQKTRITGKKVF